MQINDIDLFTETTGAGEPLVLVHGSWTDSSSWALVAPALAERFTVVTYDRRGHSRSERPVGPVVRRDDEDDLIALVDALGIGPVHLVGSSYEACIALAVAARRPDLVRTVTGHEPPFIGLLPAAEAAEVLDLMRSIVDTMAGDVVAGVRRFFEEVALGPGSWALLPEDARARFVANAPMFPHLLADPDGTTFGARLDVPATVTTGTTSPAWFRRAAARIEGVAHHVFDGAGHAPHLTHPSDYVGQIERATMSPTAS